MTSPFNSWCWNCNAFCKPNIQYRWAPAPSQKKKKKQDIALEYRAICPGCNCKMIPDKKIKAVVNLVREHLLKELSQE